MKESTQMRQDEITNICNSQFSDSYLFQERTSLMYITNVFPQDITVSFVSIFRQRGKPSRRFRSY